MELIPKRAFDRGHFPLQRQMNRLFEDFFGDSTWPGAWGRGEWVPAMDIAETDDALILTAEVPGIAAEGLDITVTGNLLTLSGEKRGEVDENEGGIRRRERSYGSFRRTVTLPGTVDPSEVDASSKDGILTVRLAKKEESKPRSVKIKVE